MSSNVYNFPAARPGKAGLGGGLSGEGGGGTIEGMEARVARLEDDMREIRTDLKALRIDTAEIKGRVGQLPSTKEMIGLVFLVLGGAFAVFKYGMH